MPASILIVDDEPHTLEGLEAALEDRYEITTANNAREAFNHIESDRFDVVLTDLRMAGKSGMSVIERTLKLSPRPVCIMMTAYGNVETAVEAMKRGAYDFLTKPVSLEKLELLIERALQSERLQEENQNLHQRLDKKFQFDEILGNSPNLQNVLETVRLVAPSKATVLIEGETGTGKELIAQAIHQNSERSRRPFVAVHCAALASNLLESELFGHEKGAFTGATERRIGRFEAADSGTLFLDEIGEIDPSTQIKLLRFLETRSFERLGSVKPVQVDVRLVCATNRDLEAMARKGDFREDLLYRLNVVTVDLPPLRQREGDISLLLEHYVANFSRENGVPPVTFSPEALSVLQKYSWPGNIRELRNFCENTVILKRGSRVTEYDLDSKFFGEQQTPTSNSKTLAANPLSVEENEKRLLRNALLQTGNNKTKAADLLGMSRRTLHRKLARWPELLES
ncbi:sigma-54-dependent transcriptional regulator [Puniceicoccus vermicola]|uniref:Sigma-54-dependent Fis family transcriptional regulator n=1 Tax=Puniceicoccus vermicola TaxID=388746 RepID=A0A7X1AY77_9BACT|nr:sigma-54 dependent transcriptional regulator [Puniceicoccus vermicola]MBC2602183.1 sigma-54-dependent Fis family transcriptional regulator [Puniceicoccus vermicola]